MVNNPTLKKLYLYIDLFIIATLFIVFILNIGDKYSTITTSIYTLIVLRLLLSIVFIHFTKLLSTWLILGTSALIFIPYLGSIFKIVTIFILGVMILTAISSLRTNFDYSYFAMKAQRQKKEEDDRVKQRQKKHELESNSTIDAEFEEK